MNICAVIPAYNEEKAIADVVGRTLAHVGTVLVVDDGSEDQTGDLAKGAGARIITNNPNLGKGASLRLGLDWAADNGFEAAITLDADGQHLPEEIPRFIEAAPNADLVIGNRMAEQGSMPYVRWQTNRFTSWVVSRLAHVRVADSQVGFRLLKTAGWKQLEIMTNNYDFESEMLVSAGRKGLRIVSVPVSTVYGEEESKINPVVDTIRFARMVWRLWRK